MVNAVSAQSAGFTFKPLAKLFAASREKKKKKTCRFKLLQHVCELYSFWKVSPPSSGLAQRARRHRDIQAEQSRAAENTTRPEREYENGSASTCCSAAGLAPRRKPCWPEEMWLQGEKAQ